MSRYIPLCRFKVCAKHEAVVVTGMAMNARNGKRVGKSFTALIHPGAKVSIASFAPKRAKVVILCTNGVLLCDSGKVKDASLRADVGIMIGRKVGV